MMILRLIISVYRVQFLVRTVHAGSKECAHYSYDLIFSPCSANQLPLLHFPKNHSGAAAGAVLFSHWSRRKIESTTSVYVLEEQATLTVWRAMGGGGVKGGTESEKRGKEQKVRREATKSTTKKKSCRETEELKKRKKKLK